MKTRLLVAAAVAAGVSASATAQVTIYFSDFEGTDGGWVNSGTGGHPGDWEYEANYDSSNYGGAYVPPDSAYSGTGMWGTIMYGDYNNSGEDNILSQTFDFSGYTSVRIDFASWSNVFTTFDYTELRVNGDLVAGSDGSGAPHILSNNNGSSGSSWVLESVDLSAYDGLGNVSIEFILSATTVVNRPGWYLDDIHVTGIPSPGALALLGLGGLAAGRRRR